MISEKPSNESLERMSEQRIGEYRSSPTVSAYRRLRLMVLTYQFSPIKGYVCTNVAPNIDNWTHENAATCGIGKR